MDMIPSLAKMLQHSEKCLNGIRTQMVEAEVIIKAEEVVIIEDSLITTITDIKTGIKMDTMTLMRI